MALLSLTLGMAAIVIALMSSHPPKVECTKKLQGTVSVRDEIKWQCDDGDWKELP